MGRYTQVREEWNRMRPHVAQAVLDRDQWVCQAPGCNASLTTGTWTIDHIVPISRGGDNRYSNLQAMCRPCNSRKGSKLVMSR